MGVHHQEPPVESDPLIPSDSKISCSTALNPSFVPSRTEIRGLLWIVLSAVMYPIPTVLVRVAFVRYGFPVWAAMILRTGTQFLFATILLVAVIRVSPLDLSPQYQFILFLRGALGSIALVAVYKALALLPAGEVTAVLAFTPVVTMLLSKLILKEIATLWDMVCAILGIIGVWLISCPRAESGSLLGVALLLLASCSSSSAYVCVRGMGTNVHFMLCVFAFGAIGLITTLLLGGQEAIDHIFTNYEGTGVILLGCMAGFVGQCCVNKGLQLCKAGEAIIVTNLEVPLSYFLSMWLLNEKPSTIRILGSILVVSAVVTVGVQRLRER